MWYRDKDMIRRTGKASSFTPSREQAVEGGIHGLCLVGPSISSYPPLSLSLSSVRTAFLIDLLRREPVNDPSCVACSHRLHFE